MSTVTNWNWMITLVGELCLFAAAIMWSDLILRGVASLGVVLPAAFTLLGVFWLVRGLVRDSRSRGSRVRSRTDRIV
jgi:hypothetical protein